MQENKTNKFTQWLETLQQESWQLELLISGFVIFLLAGVYQPIAKLEFDIQVLTSSDSDFDQLYFPFYVLMGTWFILIINLSAHVILRALWIGAIGLRYVSGDIEIESLNYNSRFIHFIKDRVGSFDAYIENLERLCSTVFAYTFLIIFIVLGFAGFLVVGQLLAFLELALTGEVYGFLNLPYIVAGLLYLIDFLTLGFLKKSRKISSWYYPIYRLFGWITLAPIYRPIYYNFIDHKYGRWVLWSIIPYFAIIALYMGMNVATDAYLPENRFNRSLSAFYYDDIWDSKFPSGRASIETKYVENGYIPLFLPYIPRNDDQVIEALCPDLKPAKTGISFFRSDPIREGMNASKALACSAERFKISVNDSLMNQLEYRFYDHPVRKRIGLVTMLDVAYLPRGEHDINIEVQLFLSSTGRDSLQFIQTDVIPFWKE